MSSLESGQAHSAPRSRSTTRGVTGVTSKTVEDIKAKALAYAEANPEKVKAESRRFYEKYKVEVNRRSLNNRHLREKGITLAQYEAIVAVHNGRCDICGTTDGGGPHNKFNLDHCHQTGTLRGMLCTRCNTGLGHFRDDIALLDAAIAYLKSPPKTQLFNKILSGAAQ